LPGVISKADSFSDLLSFCCGAELASVELSMREEYGLEILRDYSIGCDF